jgi:heptosyltransferase-2
VPIVRKQTERILLCRTDRIGDVILSTPVIKALRDAYPKSYLAMMVSPLTYELVSENPYLNEVIIFDKKKDLGFFSIWRFIRSLKKRSFDCALILHSTRSLLWLLFLAGIPERIGYARKGKLFLTQSLPYLKRWGEKHELDYNLELLRFMGIAAGEKSPFVPLKKEWSDFAANFLRQAGVLANEKIIAIHAGASCPSKIWPVERFAKVADRLAKEFKAKILLVGGPKEKNLSQMLVGLMQAPAINACAKTSIGELAGLLKRCRLFISNDSGPVHLAAALDIPVVSIFGRNDPGLSPRRWGPVSANSIVLHKPLNCQPCLAHRCQKDFACLKAISVEEVLEAAKRLLTFK